MSDIKISIITISYNAENEIEDTIKSVISQNYRPLEYIFIDGKSKDKTVDIIKSYKEQIQKLGIEFKMISEPDKGISDAFNKGINISTGDVIGLINAGDCLLKDALNCVFQNFTEDVDIIYGNTVCIDKKNKLKYLRQLPSNVDIKRIKYDGLVFTHQSAFVKKLVYEEFGVYDTSFKYVMDSDLFAKFAENDVCFKYVNSPLVSMLAGGISAKPSLQLVKENIRVAKKYGGYSTLRIYCDWVKGLPRHWIITMIKHFPSLWYKLIGEERRIKYED